jgi:hypothetical protein
MSENLTGRIFELEREVALLREVADKGEVAAERSYEAALNNVCIHAGIDVGDSMNWKEEQLSGLVKAAAGDNAVVDAIETLLGRRHAITIANENGKSQVIQLGSFTERDTLREALEACVEARDQHDKERKEQ